MNEPRYRLKIQFSQGQKQGEQADKTMTGINAVDQITLVSSAIPRAQQRPVLLNIYIVFYISVLYTLSHLSLITL